MAKNKVSVKEQLVKNSFWSLFYSIVNRIGTLIFTILLARVLLPEGYGVFSIVFSTAMVFSTFSDIGINTTFLRYLSSSIAKERHKSSAYYKYLLNVKLSLSVVVSLALLILAYPLSKYIFHNSALFIPLILSGLMIFIMTLDSFYSQIFYAIQKVKYIWIKEIVFQILRIIFIAIIFYLFSAKNYLIAIFVSLIILYLIILIIGLVYSKKLAPDIYSSSKEIIDVKRVQRFLIFVAIASISSTLFSYIDSIVLGIFVSPAYVGYYRAAFSLVYGVMGIIAFPLAILVPAFTSLTKQKIEKTVNIVIRYLSILAIPATFGIAVLANYVLKIFYGAAYLPGTVPLYILAFSLFPTLGVSLFLAFISAKEQPKLFAKLTLWTTILNILLNVILVKTFLIFSEPLAIIGAAIATLVSWIFYFSAAVYSVKKQFNLSPNFNPIIKPIIASLAMSAVILFSFKYISHMTILLGILEVLLGIIIYFLVLFLIKGVTKEDIKLIYLLKPSQVLNGKN